MFYKNDKGEFVLMPVCLLFFETVFVLKNNGEQGKYVLYGEHVFFLTKCKMNKNNFEMRTK